MFGPARNAVTDLLSCCCTAFMSVIDIENEMSDSKDFVTFVTYLLIRNRYRFPAASIPGILYSFIEIDSAPLPLFNTIPLRPDIPPHS